MKMNEYKKPIINVTRFDTENIVTLSTGDGTYKFEANPAHNGARTTWNDINKSTAIEENLKFN